METPAPKQSALDKMLTSQAAQFNSKRAQELMLAAMEKAPARVRPADV